MNSQFLLLGCSFLVLVDLSVFGRNSSRKTNLDNSVLHHFCNPFSRLISALLLEAQSTPFQVTPSTMANIVKGLYTLRPGKHSSFLLGLACLFVAVPALSKRTVFLCVFSEAYRIWICSSEKVDQILIIVKCKLRTYLEFFLCQ